MSKQIETKEKNINFTSFGVDNELVLLQVALALSPTSSETTQLAVFDTDNIALEAMHVIMHTTYVYCVHYSLKFVHKHPHNQNIQEQQEQLNDCNMRNICGKRMR